MNKTNKQGGNAHLFVLIATLLIFLLVTIALTVSASSRRLTAYYSDHANLYDLAIAGNEQVFLFMSEILEAHDTTDTASDEVMALLAAAVTNAYPREWELTVTITPDDKPALADTFRATTSVTTMADRFRTETQVNRYPSGTPATVVAYILLDGPTLKMVHSKRVVN
ncbi:MAG: hypothetical protein FWE90_01590 [Defluviitaleaceae bacterium]|nr:hypothetical protein [Defluviitaleaceae bacterium]